MKRFFRGGRWCVRARYGTGRTALRLTYRFPSRLAAREWLSVMRSVARRTGLLVFNAGEPFVVAPRRRAKGRA